MRKTVLSLLLCITLGSGPLHAQPAGQEAERCFDQVSTLAIATCLQADAGRWDQRLNAAYAALQERIAPQQRQPLRDAQRLWVRYRDANCGFYGAREGSMRQIEAAQCLRDMTRARTRELEAAMPVY